MASPRAHASALLAGGAARAAGAGLVVSCLALGWACSGNTGLAPAPSAIAAASADATTADVVATPRSVRLSGTVEGAGSRVAGAIVVVEVGGLDQTNPAGLGSDGGVGPTLEVDPFIRYASLTGDAGAFAVAAVPEGPLGLHTFAPAYLEDRRTVRASASPDATPTVVMMAPASADAGNPTPDAAVIRPTVTGLGAFTAAAFPTPVTFVAPLAPISFAVAVARGASADPLSEDVFLVEPTTQWASALVPPAAAVPGGAYPDGVYSLVVQAPGAPGSYAYTVLAASMSRVTSLPVSIVVTVTPGGAPPLPDASPDAPFYVEGGGLPDGRY